MTRDTRTQLIAFVSMLFFLGASTALAVSLSGMLGRYKLTYADRAEEGQPREVALGIAMGAFRGIFVNFLWMRANDMKEAGKFYEAVQLARTITKLQPRFPRVWVFHAWNLAYNISVQTQTPEERWQWVNRGVELLRDEGIPANPNDMLLHKELGWIFLHKIGGFTDDANPVYKRALAQEWTIALGPPPTRTAADRDRDHAIRTFSTWLDQFVTAPDTLDELIEAQPAVKDLVARIREIGVEPGWDLLGRYELWSHMQKSSQRDFFSQAIGQKTQSVGALMADPQFKEAWPALLAHLRRRILIDKYHMEPERMQRYTEKFGPIDWRHHAAHAVYWAQRGVDVGLTRWTEYNKRDYDFINTDRIVAQGIQDLFRSGEVYFDFFSSMIPNRYTMLQGVPNAHFVQAYGDIIDEQRERSFVDATDARGFSPLSAGYENFLRDAVMFFYRRNDLKAAEYWLTRLRNFPAANLNDQERRDLTSRPISEFVAKELATRLSSPSVMINQVSGSIMAAFSSGLLAGDQEIFLSQMDFAKKAHRYYMEQQVRRTVVGGEGIQRMEQMDADFRVVSGVLFAQFMQTLGLDDAERVFDMAPNDLRQWAYGPLEDLFRLPLDNAIKQAGPDSKIRGFNEIFPEPKDMADFRTMMEAMMRERGGQGSGVEQK
jgi:hypothetical protein